MNKFKFLNDNFCKKGYKIFPLKWNSKEPAINTWQTDASCSAMQLMYWLEYGDNLNFALPAFANNLFIIDIDRHDVDGLESFKKMLHDLGIDHIDTLMQTTPSGGLHLIFKSDEELNGVKNKAQFFENYPGIDVRTRGYIAIEPSTIDGNEYKLIGSTDKICAMPNNLRTLILEENAKIVKNNSDLCKTIASGRKEKVLKGNRDDEMFRYINYLYYYTRLSYDEIYAIAHDYNEKAFEPKMRDKEIDDKIDRAFKSPRSKLITIRLDDRREGVIDE